MITDTKNYWYLNLIFNFFKNINVNLRLFLFLEHVFGLNCKIL
jgi:hypothetical protein